MTKILVLGVSGMLGSMVFDYFSNHTNHKTYGTVRNKKYQKSNIFLFDAYYINKLKSNKFKELNIEFIINCIGITKPFSKDSDPEGVKRAIRINSDFPWKLAKYAKNNSIKILQIGTDCVYSGKKGNYKENDLHDPLDVYGKSKSLGEVFDTSTLIIRCSIIGPELKKESTFLLEWFLSQENGETINGYEHHLWNGITTLQFAKICEKIIDSGQFNVLVKKNYVHHFKPNNIVNKFDLMHIFNKVFQKNLQINKVNKPDQKLDRTLDSNFENLQKIYGNKTFMKEAIQELKNYMDS